MGTRRMGGASDYHKIEEGRWSCTQKLSRQPPAPVISDTPQHDTAAAAAASMTSCLTPRHQAPPTMKARSSSPARRCSGRRIIRRPPHPYTALQLQVARAASANEVDTSGPQESSFRSAPLPCGSCPYNPTAAADAKRGANDRLTPLDDQPPPRIPTCLPGDQPAHVAATTTRADQHPHTPLKNRLPLTKSTLQGPPTTPEDFSPTNRRRACPHAYQRLKPRT